MKLRAVLYARVSTRDQKSIPDQLVDLHRYAERQGWEVVQEYEERESGKRDTRPVRYEIIKRAWLKRKGFDVVLVWKLDRWGRSIRDLINTIHDLAEHEVDFVSLTDGLDFSSPTGRLMFHVLAAFAEFEREIIIERTKAGVIKKRARMEAMGRSWGRPAKARGKTKMVLYLAGEGQNNTQIAKALKISRASVMRIRRANVEAT